MLTNTAFVIVAVLLVSSMAGPMHASCKLQWQFSSDCDTVQAAFVQAVSGLSGDSCGSGEVCMYTLKAQTNSRLSIVHTTPVKHYKDDLTLSFADGSNKNCAVSGFSTSETWYAVLDYGTNYCNLENLALQTKIPFTESVSDDTCTQYTSSNCAKY